MKGDKTGMPWVDWTARRIGDPILRLRFLRAAAPVWQPKSTWLWKRYRLRWTWLGLLAGLTLLSITLLLVAAGFLQAQNAKSSRGIAEAGLANPSYVAYTVSIPAGVAVAKEGTPQEIWPIEKTAAYETYSNGLRIDNKFSTLNHPRSYMAFRAAASGKDEGEARTTPAGIVFHTTESLQAPFEQAQNGKLVKVGEALLDYVKRKKAYNFVIDRFGRVFRVVREQDAAEHAGYSVWSDDKWLYLNLNESFLGVAVETRTQAGQTTAAVTAAQVRAIAMLTEMLRNRFRIPAANCVTHAQVSVNPSRMLAGYHMDWASSFPFEEVGLPDNYLRPLASVAAFGFQCDASYERIGGSRLSEGANQGARELANRAAEAGMSVQAYRQAQQRRYRERLAAIRGAAVSHEGD